MDSARLPDKQAKELENVVAILDDVFSGRTEWEGRPFHVEISTNNACNLTCVMCERPDLSYIGPEKLDQVAEQVFPAASVITPSATSEPAMGDFDHILDHCEKHDLRLNLITNATLLTDRHIRRLKGRVFKCDVSIDSHIPSVYEEIRRGARFERMRAGLRRLVKLSEEDGFALTMVVVLMKQNLTTLDGTVAFAKREGIRRLRVQKMLPFFSEPHRFHVAEHFAPAEIRTHLDRAKRAAAALGVDLSLDLDPPEHVAAPALEPPRLSPPVVINTVFEALQARRAGFCFQLASYVRILPNGNVYPCCRGWDEHLLMGNVFDQSFDAIWNGEAYQQLRREFLSGNLREGCRQCTLSGQGTL